MQFSWSRCLFVEMPRPAEVGCPYGNKRHYKRYDLPVMGAIDTRQKVSDFFKLLGSSSLQCLPDN